MNLSNLTHTIVVQVYSDCLCYVTQLEDKQAWQLVDRPRNAKILPGLWQFKIKKDALGNRVKYKARWCVDGSRSPLEILPESKFSPVAEKTRVRILFAIAAYKGVSVMQADFPNAYLNATITEDVYVVQPRGLENPNLRQKVCRLNKAPTNRIRATVEFSYIN